jgi:type IV secretory pathway TraG/TraD family ATPase VirD4
MVTETLPDEEFIGAEAAVVVVRLVVAGALWCLALWMLDQPSRPASDPYVFNTRVMLWLFLVEILIGVYSVRYSAMTSYPFAKRAAFLLAESGSQAWQMAVYAALNLLIRYVVVTLLTGGAVYLAGNGFLTRLVPFGMAAGFYVACLYQLSNMASPTMIRGTHIGSYKEAMHRARMMVMGTRNSLVDKMRANGTPVPEPEKVQVLSTPVGGLLLPTVTLEPHYLFLGTTNSGKTLSVRMLLESVLMRFGELKQRALMYDGKREYYPLLIGMGIPAEKIIILNPADERCVAWAIAKDVRNRDDAVNLTAILVPDRKESNDNLFFIQALRSLVAAVMMALHSISPDTWTLFDVVFAMGTPSRMKRLLRTTKEGEEIISRYFTDAKETVGGIVSTIDARFINEYKTLALMWRSCTQSISLTEWVKSDSILLMGFDANNQAVDRVNQAIFQRASQLLCSLPEASDSDYSHTWVVLDEVRFTGRLPMVSELMSFGRTKRVHVVLAPQDVDGLTDAYGEHRTQEMLGLCGNVGVLRLTSNKTRDWAAKFFGDYESWETETNQSVTHSSGYSGSSGTRSTSYTSGSSTRRVKRESILPSEFLNLPQTNRENGMHGFFATPVMGCWRAQIPPGFIDDHLTAGDPKVHAFIPRSSFRVNPGKWSPEEEQKYGGQQPTVDAVPLDDEDAAGQAPGTAEQPQKGKSGPAKDSAETNKSGGSTLWNQSSGSTAEPLPDW